MRNEIIKLEEELRLAMLSSDVKKLDELIADSLLFVAPNGQIATKQMDLDAHKSGLQKMTKLIQSDQTIEIHENTAIVTVKAEIEGTFGEASINGIYRYLRVWQKINDKFQIIAGSVALILS